MKLRNRYVGHVEVRRVDAEGLIDSEWLWREVLGWLKVKDIARLEMVNSRMRSMLRLVIPSLTFGGDEFGKEVVVREGRVEDGAKWNYYLSRGFSFPKLSVDRETTRSTDGSGIIHTHNLRSLTLVGCMGSTYSNWSKLFVDSVPPPRLTKLLFAGGSVKMPMLKSSLPDLTCLLHLEIRDSCLDLMGKGQQLAKLLPVTLKSLVISHRRCGCGLLHEAMIDGDDFLSSLPKGLEVLDLDCGPFAVSSKNDIQLPRGLLHLSLIGVGLTSSHFTSNFLPETCRLIDTTNYDLDPHQSPTNQPSIKAVLDFFARLDHPCKLLGISYDAEDFFRELQGSAARGSTCGCGTRVVAVTTPGYDGTPFAYLGEEETPPLSPAASLWAY